MNRRQKWITAGIILYVALFSLVYIFIPRVEWDRKLIRTSGEFTICELSTNGHSKSIWVYHSDKCDPEKSVGRLKD